MDPANTAAMLALVLTPALVLVPALVLAPLVWRKKMRVRLLSERLRKHSPRNSVTVQRRRSVIASWTNQAPSASSLTCCFVATACGAVIVR